MKLKGKHKGEEAFDECLGIWIVAEGWRMSIRYVYFKPRRCISVLSFVFRHESFSVAMEIETLLLEDFVVWKSSSV